MKNVYVSIIIAVMAVSSGLYAQEKEVQGEPLPVQTGEVKLELVWEKEIPSTIKDNWPYPGDLVFLDEDGYNVFSSQCNDPEKALHEKRFLMVQDGKLKLFEGDEMRLKRETEIKGTYAISKNGHNIAVLDGLTLHLLDWQGNELAQGKIIGGGEENHLYPLGNDQTIAISSVWGDGRFHEIAVYVRDGKELKKVFGKEGKYPTGLFDCAEDGSTIFFIYNDKPVDGKSNLGVRIVVDGQGREIVRYEYQYQGYRGWVSPQGNYLLECLGGGNLVIRNKQGELITEEQGYGGSFVAFSSNEKYFCLTPGKWRVYFFEVESGKLLWEYVDTLSHYRSIAVVPQGDKVLLSSTLFHPTDFTLAEMANKSLVIFNQAGQILNKSVVSSVKTSEELEFYRWESVAPPLRITPDGKFFLVRLPNRLLLYQIAEREGG